MFIRLATAWRNFGGIRTQVVKVEGCPLDPVNGPLFWSVLSLKPWLDFSPNGFPHLGRTQDQNHGKDAVEHDGDINLAQIHAPAASATIDVVSVLNGKKSWECGWQNQNDDERDNCQWSRWPDDYCFRFFGKTELVLWKVSRRWCVSGINTKELYCYNWHPLNYRSLHALGCWIGLPQQEE